MELRLVGQGVGIEVEVAEGDGLAEVLEKFSAEYEVLYGYRPDAGRVVECVAMRAILREVEMDFREEFFGDEVMVGPMVLQDRFSTCVVGDGWGMRRGDGGTMLLEKIVDRGLGMADKQVDGEVRAALFRSRFEGMVGEMGELLRRTAVSTNVKERLDFSCALLDAEGRLVVNAPHVPVHLGALGVCVRELAARLDFRRGDVAVVNHPGLGGSHLPDVTMVAAVFDGEGRRLGFVANRAHHAEIGGMAPGSMPAGARFLEEEGVVIPAIWWVREGRVFREELRGLLLGAPYPTRRVEENLADLEAQAAAVLYGVRELERLAATEGAELVCVEMEGILAGSGRLMGELLERVGDSCWVGEEVLDDGSVLAVRIRLVGGELGFDFAGTSGVHAGNLNATPAIVRSVVLYVLRVWLAVDVPLNEGLLERVEVLVPEGMLNPGFGAGSRGATEDRPHDRRHVAVVGGNVETSQRLADLLLGALGLCANGPGSMNNFLFGNGRDGYYETIGGGAGAGNDAEGKSGRHVHMTNTAITDAEVLEHRFPLRLWEFSVRRGSGGEGRFRGGDGLVREVEFLEPMTVSFLTERRATVPKGMNGGGAGAMGRQVRIFPDGSEEGLAGRVTFEVAKGERVRVETPGGGGNFKL